MVNSKKVTIKGFEKVKRNLEKEIRAIKGRTLEGLIHAQITVYRDMEPMIPIDLGNLRSSYFAVTSKGIENGEAPTFKGPKAGELKMDHTALISEIKSAAVTSGKPLVIMGFSVNYAAFVHEMEGGNWQRYKENILREIAQYAK